jgi:hypothetical protein
MIKNSQDIQHFIVSPPKTSTISLRAMFYRKLKIPVLFSHNFINKEGIFTSLIHPLLERDVFSDHVNDSILHIINHNKNIDPLYLYIVYRNPFERMFSCYLEFHKKNPKFLHNMYKNNPTSITADFNNFIRNGINKHGLYPLTYDYLVDLGIDIFRYEFNETDGGNVIRSNNDKNIVAIIGRFDKIELFKNEIIRVLKNDNIIEIDDDIDYPKENVSKTFFGVGLYHYIINNVSIDIDIVEIIFASESKYIEHFYGKHYLNELNKRYTTK